MNENKEMAFFGGGCFWCLEAVFLSIKGISSVISGYAGGAKENPTYEEVSGGNTGHAEVVKIEFDPAQISYRDLLTVFFAMHDPTTPNRQGNDVGSQYRSIILYTNAQQMLEALQFIKDLDEHGEHIVTEVKPLSSFYVAEDYHKNYYAQHHDKPYCQMVISPKLDKLKEKFYTLIKEQSA